MFYEWCGQRLVSTPAENMVIPLIVDDEKTAPIYTEQNKDVEKTTELGIFAPKVGG